METEWNLMAGPTVPVPKVGSQDQWHQHHQALVRHARYMESEARMGGDTGTLRAATI